MSDDDKNKQETIGELLALRRRVEELEQMEDKFKGVEKGLQKGHRLYARAEKLGNFGHWGRNFLKDKAFWSEGMYDIFGVKPEDFQSTLEYFLKFVHPSDKKHLRSSIESSLSNREPLEVEYRIIRPDGEKRTVFSTAEIQVDPSGQPVGLFGICQDITERKRIERALRESEEKFRLAFRTTPDPISLSRLSDGMYIDINEGFTEVLGYTREDVIGKTSLELNIWSDPKDRERLVAALRSEGFAENLEAKFRRLDGEIRIGLMSARVLSMNQNNVILSVTRDITESKREEEALRQRTHDLGQRVKELNCLYGTSRLVEKGDISQEEIMIETLKLISPSMQYPENTGARITFEGREYKTERILFVDDEEAIAKLGGLVLESYGYQVSVETNPTRALELFCSNPAAFDLVITDMTMPSMTGDKLIQEILKIRAGMPTILCTGFSERIDEERAKSIGVEAYALKPLDRKSLITIVRQVLDKRKSTQMAKR